MPPRSPRVARARVVVLSLLAALFLSVAPGPAQADPAGVGVHVAASSAATSAAAKPVCSKYSPWIKRISVRFCLTRAINDGYRVYTATAFIKSKRPEATSLTFGSESTIDESVHATSGGRVRVAAQKVTSAVIDTVRLADDGEEHHVTFNLRITSRNTNTTYAEKTLSALL